MRCPIFFSLVVASLLSPAAHAATRGDARPERASHSAVEQLIAELGAEDYTVRRRAEAQLLKLGLQAFDALQAAEDHEDLEIAERVRYIVQQMAIDWVQADDPGDVRRLLARYGDLSERDRRERIRQLAELDDRAGLAALCRIARFDPSPLASRHAAIALLQLELSPDERSEQAADCLAELGSNNRPPVQWLRLFFRETDDFGAVRDEWLAAIDAEARLLTDASQETSFEIVQPLLERHLERCRSTDSADAIAAALFRIVDLIGEQLQRCRDADYSGDARNTIYALVRWNVEYGEPDARAAGVAWALQWALRNQRWDVLAPLESRFEDKFRTHRKLRYYLAAAAGRAGRGERAEELANQAFQLVADDQDQRVDIADKIAELGRIDWAEREYRQVIDDRPVTDVQSVDARTNLAIWLHDRGDFAGAAGLLGDLCDVIESDEAAKRTLLSELNEASGAGVKMLDLIAARREYYRACQAEASNDFVAQRRHLDEAARRYDADPDILIAMYRSPGADDEYLRRTRTRIAAMTKQFQMLIDEEPDRPSFYNQWAWLVANTEGDQQRAVQYSLRSLELSPEEPSYLDTLGRCYFAVGDLENAVTSQRRAVELAPHYQVMQRQLELFERALAEKSDEER